MTGRMRWAALVWVAGVVVLLVSCGGSPANSDTPIITNLFPSNITAGGPAFSLNVAGTGFISTSVVYWNNSPRVTTYNTTSTELAAAITAQDIATSGTAQVLVVTPGPGGGASGAVSFTINSASNPLPAISSLSPAAVAVCTPAGTQTCSNSTLTVNGTNFIAGSVVSFNGIARPTTYIGSSQLTASILSADLASNASIAVTVSNPAPGGGVSSAASLKVGTGSAVRMKSSVDSAGQLPQVVSLGAWGAISNGHSGAPAVSSDGRFIAFYSTATNLVEDGASGNIFMRDTCGGAANCTVQTIALDLAADGGAPDLASQPQVAISGNGRFVAFVSQATNLVPGFPLADERDSKIYVRDLCIGVDSFSGCQPSTSLASIPPPGSLATRSSNSPSISADGRFVAFVSDAVSNPGQNSSGTVLYVRDTCAGIAVGSICSPTTLEAERDSQTISHPVLSANGRYIAFDALVATSAPETRGREVLLHDTCLGADVPVGCLPGTIPVSLAADASYLPGANQSPSISADGRFIAFASVEAGEQPSIFLRDTCNDASASEACVPSTRLLAMGAAYPSINALGRYISFLSLPTTADSQRSGAEALTIYDTCLAAAQQCAPGTRLILSAGGTASAAAPMAGDGGQIVFPSSAVIAGLSLSGQGDVLMSSTAF